MTTITIDEFTLRNLLVEAAHLGASQAINELSSFNMKDAAEQLGISYNTLLRRVQEGKIRPVDGRISGAEISRYLNLDERQVRLPLD